MKIFFTASLTGKKFYLNNYHRIVDILIKMGHKVIAEHIFEKERPQVERESWEARIKYQKDFHQWLSQSDLVVAEISYPSTGVGYQITQAMDRGKPVLALHLEEKIPIALLGELSEKLILESYNITSLEKDLTIGLNDAVNKMDVRFNFFISPKIGSYLDWVAKNKKLPRAVYLRKLIEDDMTKSDYEQSASKEEKTKQQKR